MDDRKIVHELSTATWSSECECITEWLLFFISSINLHYASTLPSGNATLNTKRTTGPAMIS